MEEESQEYLEEYLRQAEVRWYQLLEEGSKKIDKKDPRTEEWQELAVTIEKGNKHWEKKVEKSDNPSSLVKPEVLLLGPRPKVIRKQKPVEEEIQFEIFPLPKPRGTRGGYINRKKRDLSCLDVNLKYETDENEKLRIKKRITDIKKDISAYRRQIRKDKRTVKAATEKQ